jgi:hypothetical protein
LFPAAEQGQVYISSEPKKQLHVKGLQTDGRPRMQVPLFIRQRRPVMNGPHASETGRQLAGEMAFDKSG